MGAGQDLSSIYRVDFVILAHSRDRGYDGLGLLIFLQTAQLFLQIGDLLAHFFGF